MSESSTSSDRIDRPQHDLLVVDDNPASRYATARWLRAAGFRTRRPPRGRGARRVPTMRVSAMVLDVHLPDIDGFESVPRCARGRNGRASRCCT